MTYKLHEGPWIQWFFLNQFNNFFYLNEDLYNLLYKMIFNNLLYEKTSITMIIFINHDEYLEKQIVQNRFLLQVDYKLKLSKEQLCAEVKVCRSTSFISHLSHIKWKKLSIFFIFAELRWLGCTFWYENYGRGTRCRCWSRESRWSVSYSPIIHTDIVRCIYCCKFIDRVFLPCFFQCWSWSW